jgi:hypothetical protein
MTHRVVLVWMFGALAAAGCKHDTPAPVIHAVSEAPVPAPASLTAEGTLRDPDAFWSRVRTGGGTTLSDTPTTAAGVLLLLAGCDPGIGSLVAGDQPFHVAVGDSPEGTAFAIAMKIRDLGAAQGALADGGANGYRSEQVGTMIHFVPPAGTELHVALGVTPSGYLVIASSVAELTTLGSYAARTLPTKAPASSSLELRANPAALARAGPAAPAFAARITRMLAASARGPLPPEVDANALAACFTPSIEAAAAAASDLGEARVDVDAVGAEVHAVATLVPKQGDNKARQRIAAMHPADAAQLLDAPLDATASLFMSDTSAERAADVGTIGPCMGHALGPILGGGGDAKLVDVVASWAHGRGDWETVSIVARGATAGLVARAPVATGEDLSRSLRSFASLASQPSVQDVIRRLLPSRAGGVDTAEVPGVGKASVLMFAPSVAPARFADAAPEMSLFSPPGLAWLVGPMEVDLGLGLSPESLLALTHPPAALGTDPVAAHAVRAIGANATLAAVFRPPACCAGGRPGSGPLTLAWGRKDGSGWGSLGVGDELVGGLAGRAARH